MYFSRLFSRLNTSIFYNIFSKAANEFLIRNTECADVDMYANNRAHLGLEDVAQNADLYIANQAVSSQP